MFTGSHFHNMDNKGRVSIPSRYREILLERQDRQLILTNYLTTRGERYILAFPQSEWVKIEAQLMEQRLFDKDLRAFQRFLISGVEECPLDRQGRILIPPNLRDYAKLSREVCIVGAVRSFEIWDRQAYGDHRQLLEESIGQEVYEKLLI
jgi:MraZ protein